MIFVTIPVLPNLFGRLVFCSAEALFESYASLHQSAGIGSGSSTSSAAEAICSACSADPSMAVSINPS